MIWKCSLCGMSYPARGWHYWVISVCQRNHMICDECHQRLIFIDAEEQDSFPDKTQKRIKAHLEEFKEEKA